MPKGLQVQTTGSSIAGGGQVHKFLDDGSVVLGSGSLAAGVDNKSVVFFDSTNGVGDVTVWGDLSASVGITASAFHGDGSNLTGIAASSITVADGGDNDSTVYILGSTTSAGSGADILTDGQLTYNNSTNALTVTTVVGTNVSGSAKLATARLEDVGGALALAGGAAVTIDATTGLSLDAGAASNFSTSAGALTLDGAGGINIGTASDVAIDIDSSTLDIDASGAVTIDSTSTIVLSGDGGATLSDDTEGLAYDGSGNVDFDAVALDIDASGAVTIDGTSTLSIDSADDSNLTVTGAGKDLDIAVAGGSTQELRLASAGTGASALHLNASAGGIDIDSADMIDIDAADEITIDTTSADGHIAITSAHTAGDAILISANANAGSILDVDAGIMDVDVQGTYALDASGVSIDSDASSNLSVATGGSDDVDLTIASTGGGDSSVLISSAGTGADALSLDVSAGSMVVAPSLADGQTLKLGKNGAVEMVFTPHGTAGNEKFSLTNTAGTAANAIAIDASAGGISIDGAAASNFTTSGGDLTLTATGTSNKLVLSGALNSTGVSVTSDLTVADGSVAYVQALTASYAVSASYFEGDGSRLTNIPAPSTTNIDDTSDADTTFYLVGVDGLTDSETLQAGDDLTFNPSSNVLTAANISGSTKLATARIEDVGGALTLSSYNGATTIANNAGGANNLRLVSTGTGTNAVWVNASAGGVDIDSAAAITVDATTGLSLDAGAASNFSTSAGALTLDGAGGINIGTASDVAVDVDADTFDLDASGAVTIDGAGIALAGGANASSFNVATGGADAKDLTISVTGGGDSSLLLASAGTGADAIQLNASAGSVDIDSADNVTIDAADDISLTTTSADGLITLHSAHTAGQAVLIDANAAAGSILDIDAGIMDVDVQGTYNLDASGITIASDSASSVSTTSGDLTLSATGASNKLVLSGALDATGVNVTSDATFAQNVVVSGDLTVNGTTTTVDTTNLLVKDKLITINDGGADNTARGAGIEFEENGSIAGFIKTSSDGEEFEFKVPEGGHTLVLDVDADKTVTVAGALNIEADSVINQDLSTDSTTATFAGLSLSDGNITNVGDINADSISVDAAGTGLNVDFSGGNTGTNAITLQDGIADALSVTDGSNDWMVFNTSAETLQLGRDTNVVGNLSASMNISASVNVSASAFYGDGSNLTGVGGAVSAVSDSEDYHFSILDSNSAQDGATFYVENDNILKYNPSNDHLMLSGTIFAHTGAYNTLSMDYLSGASGKNIEISSEQDVVFVIDANGSGTQNYEFKAGQTSVAELNETGHFQLSGALSASLTISGASDLIIDGNAQFNGNQMVVTGTLHASAFVGDGSQLTNIAAPSTVNIDDSGDADTTYYLVGVDGLTNSETLEAGDDLTFNASSNLLTVANVSGSGKLATARVEDAGGALAIFGGAAVTIDATTGLSLDAGAASNLSTSAGALTVHGAGGINIGTTSDVAIDIDSSTLDIDASDAITIDSTSTIVISGDGGATLSDDTEALAYDGSGNVDFDAVALDIDASGAVTLDTSSTLSIDSQDDSNLTVTAAGKDLDIAVAGGSTQELRLASAGTGASALHLNASAGGIDIDSADMIDIDAADEITIDTTSADGHIAVTSAHTAGQAILISANAAAGSILDVDAGIMDVDVQGTYNLDASGITVASDAASSVTTTSGDLTLTATGASNKLVLSGALDATGVNVTSDATFAQDVVVTGDLTVNGTTTTLNTTNLLVEDPIVVLNKANGSANGQGGIAIENGGSSTDMVFGRVANDTWGVGTKDTSGGTVTTLADMTLTTFRASKLEIDGATDYIDVDTDLKLIAAADIVLDPGGSDVKVDGNLLPNASDGGALGSADLEWSDLFLADDAVIKFGDGQDVQLAHDNTNQLLTFSATNSDYGLKMPSVNGASAQGQAFLESIVTGTTAGNAGTAESAYNGVMFYLAAVHGGSATAGQSGYSAQLTFTTAGKFYFIENGVVFPSPFISE